MALQISKTANVFTLKGRLSAGEVFQARSFFLHKLSFEESFTISLAGLDDLDLSGALMFKGLKDEAIRINKSVKIVNGENQKILGPFRKLEDQFVLSVAA